MTLKNLIYSLMLLTLQINLPSKCAEGSSTTSKPIIPKLKLPASYEGAPSSLQYTARPGEQETRPNELRTTNLSARPTAEQAVTARTLHTDPYANCTN